MKERPILFSAPMVRAILDGRKTQTRRIVKPQPLVGFVGATAMHSGDPIDDVWYDEHEVEAQEGPRSYRCPYGVPGDRLWCRETWQLVRPTDYEGDFVESVEVWDGKAPKAHPGGSWRVWYGADLFGTDEDPGIIGRAKKDQMVPRWRPSIFTPRWASRITLEVTDVRVERLNDISEEDARAEGVESGVAQNGSINGQPATVWVFDPRKGFALLWESINGPDAWDANPWVWAITFKRVTP